MAQGAWFVALKLILGAFWSTHFVPFFGDLGRFCCDVGYDVPPPATLVPPEILATIRARKKADGTVSYTVQIRLKKKGALVYQESQTFARKQAAQAWAKRRETELAEPGAIERANRGGHAVKDMIDRSLVEAEKARPLGNTKR